ncbi:ChaN family lipoprotein [Roseovarius sp. LXJ103]|uniref:ChaN family lipoprotein n=1 Tax=Roseovarius carneus TaxID=2853164 RepID=UPI000D6051F1|nr:ChaN family lipoprotein [Roseovarius carneus]MBZ8118231.1 ChaN family lipoprotein [Roseovarius carneus]PWE36046.1 hypothetical protein DD563_08800 [Pelagicola sp. LXJ1103]
MRVVAALIVALCAPLGAAAQMAEALSVAAGADVVILGEAHDNPDHHAVQAAFVAGIAPAAIVFEMLDAAQAGAITPDLLANEAALEATLGWEASGWPDFSMYYPIFEAAGDAAFYGAAVPRAKARASMSAGVVAAFGPEAGLYGLDSPLEAAEQETREAMQMAAHCDAMPVEMLPAMVDIQRLRDARLAQVAVTAMRETGGPVVVITGNGHARADWGVPVYIMRAAPELSVFTLAQGEDGRPPPGVFDAVLDAPAPDRPDPCLAFQ